MKIDINKYSNKVISDYSLSRVETLLVNKEKERTFKLILSDVISLVDDHTIKDYDVVISDDGSLIGIEIDIGYFNEEVADSAFLRLLNKCVQFEIHPANLTSIRFVFTGIWDKK